MKSARSISSWVRKIIPKRAPCGRAVTENSTSGIGAGRVNDSENTLSTLSELNKKYKISSLDVSTINVEISPEDNMFVDSNKSHYFNVGFSGLRNIILALSHAQKTESEIGSILVFPSGWGRELRFIRAYFAASEITACDIEESAIRFCGEQFKVTPLLSQNKFSMITLERQFDLIWCGSLFTHFNEERGTDLLHFFSGALAENGILSFSTHGRYSRHLLSTGRFTYGLERPQTADLIREYDRTGYGYVNYRGSADYGISLMKPSWIIALLERNENWKLISYHERGYDNHQDVITCIKQPVSD